MWWRRLNQRLAEDQGNWFGDNKRDIGIISVLKTVETVPRLIAIEALLQACLIMLKEEQMSQVSLQRSAAITEIQSALLRLTG